MAEPLERLTAIFGGPYLIERKLGSGGEDSGPRSRIARLTDSHPIPSTPRMDSPVLGAGAMIGCNVAGWFLISWLVRVVLGDPDTMATVATFWFSQFGWGAVLAFYFGRRKMLKARSAVVFVLLAALLLTVGCVGFAFMISGGL